MRRYRSLGLLKRSNNQGHRSLRNQHGVQRFISESQVKDLVLYRRLARSHPNTSLELADDVDWQLEYFCDKIGKWIMRILGWLLWLIQLLTRFIPFSSTFKRKRDPIGVPARYCPPDKDGDTDTRRIRRVNRMTMDIVGRKQWRYDECRPFQNRRIIKRKWFLKPETRRWAVETVKLYHRHVHRGFRSLCSSIGKDTKILVTDPISPRPRSTFVFWGDATVLSSQSQLFNWWFEESGNQKEIETGFVTPDEMEAILVYIYTLTWPMSMMVTRTRGEGKRKILDYRFIELLEMYGISLKLNKENPFQVPLSDLPANKILVEFGKTVSQEDILCDSFLHPSLQYIFSDSSGSGLDGQGDCHFATEVKPLILNRKGKFKRRVRFQDTTLPKRYNSFESEDNSNASNMSFLWLMMTHPFSRRIHPEIRLCVHEFSEINESRSNHSVRKEPTSKSVTYGMVCSKCHQRL